MLTQSFLTALSVLGYLSQGANAEPRARTTLATSIKPTTTTSSDASQETGVGFWPSYTPTKGQKVEFGDTLNITWGYDPQWDGTLTITLIGGGTQVTQVPLGVIAKNVDNKDSYYLWDVTNKFIGKHAVYGFSVLYEDGKTRQYSMPFQIV